MFTLKEKIFLAIATIFFVGLTYFAHCYLESFDNDLPSKPLENSVKQELDL
jgi:hypothetical protein